MNVKTAYQQKLEAQIDLWKKQLDVLKAKAAKAEASARVEYEKEINGLSAKMEELKGKLSDLKESGDSAWEDLKIGADNALQEMEKAINSATSRFTEK